MFERSLNKRKKKKGGSDFVFVSRKVNCYMAGLVMVGTIRKKVDNRKQENNNTGTE